MAKKTLAERVLEDFLIINLKKSSVKVPKLKIRKTRNKKTEKEKIEPKNNLPASSIVNILIKSAIEKTKLEKKEKPKAEDDKKTYKIIKDDKEPDAGGYGAVSKGYGIAPHSSYADYGKLFSYLGKFKAQNPYESIGSPLETLNKSLESGTFTLVDRETMEKGKTYVRYFNSKIPIDKSSLVPLAGMNSAEWEEFKMWMRLDTAMYLLKISTS